MDKEIAVNKTLRDLRSTKILTSNDSGYARKYLEILWSAGYEEGRRRLYAAFKKSITLYNIPQQKKIKTFESAAEASRQTKIPLRSIYHATQRDSISMKGFYWRYEPTSSTESSPQP
jgi:hypothetical protein